MIKHLISSAFFLFVAFALFSRDTILVMNYNLLYYGYNTDFCTNENNNVDTKAANLNIIINHIRPDIFTVNELGRNASTADHLLNNALNKNGINYYERAAYTNTANSSIVNMLYYNKNKFGLASQAIPSNTLRDINLYKLYYKSEDLAETLDTTFVVCIVAHLKAGSTADDQQIRANMVNNVMSYLDYFKYTGNVMFMGDFNMKNSYETAYQTLVNYNANPNIRFYDPVDSPGQWYDNINMAIHHTQSTRTSGSTCFASGGMDDRFDLILVSNDLLTGDQGFKYIEDTYMAIGQDGQRLNMSLISPPNYSQPSHVINALYNFSDHLPVALKLELTEKIPNRICNNFATNNYFSFNNPVRNSLELIFNFDNFSGGKVRILNMLGHEVLAIDVNKLSHYIDVTYLIPGMYFIVFEDSKSQKFVNKLLKI
jgi:endonuclease/exonuclease/phosphatase family metal-dependent hydrolase